MEDGYMQFKQEFNKMLPFTSKQQCDGYLVSECNYSYEFIKMPTLTCKQTDDDEGLCGIKTEFQ